MCVCGCVCGWVFVCVCACVVCLCACLCVCACVICVCVREREREKGRYVRPCGGGEREERECVSAREREKSSRNSQTFPGGIHDLEFAHMCISITICTHTAEDPRCFERKLLKECPHVPKGT